MYGEYEMFNKRAIQTSSHVELSKCPALGTHLLYKSSYNGGFLSNPCNFYTMSTSESNDHYPTPTKAKLRAILELDGDLTGH
jgi:hypothetical protein